MTLDERAAEMIERLYDPGPIPGPEPTKLDYEVADLCAELRLGRATEKLEKALTDLVEFSALMMKQTREWNEAVERVIGRRPNTGIETQRMSLALMAAQDLLAERQHARAPLHPFPRIPPEGMGGKVS